MLIVNHHLVLWSLTHRIFLLIPGIFLILDEKMQYKSTSLPLSLIKLCKVLLSVSFTLSGLINSRASRKQRSINTIPYPRYSNIRLFPKPTQRCQLEKLQCGPCQVQRVPHLIRFLYRLGLFLLAHFLRTEKGTYKLSNNIVNCLRRCPFAIQKLRSLLLEHEAVSCCTSNNGIELLWLQADFNTE